MYIIPHLNINTDTDIVATASMFSMSIQFSKN